MIHLVLDAHREQVVGLHPAVVWQVEHTADSPVWAGLAGVVWHDAQAVGVPAYLPPAWQAAQAAGRPGLAPLARRRPRSMLPTGT